LSTAHLGKEDRDLGYEKEVQLQPHVVYLANSSNVKVGVTRSVQIPTRWIDQGAHEAIPVVEVPNRYLAGITEVALKSHVSDKTNWRKMLTNDIKDLDLKTIRDDLLAYIPDEEKPYIIEHTVPKENVIAFLQQRGESEIIVDPNTWDHHWGEHVVVSKIDRKRTDV
jgi:hypothetical protein